MKIVKRVIFTDRSVLSVDLFLKDIRKYPVLSAEEEYDLWKRMQKGSSAAREQLINCNMRFVVTLAKKYLGNGVALEDLMMCGAIGLTLAADRFDATRGYRFLTYATWMVEAELKKAVAKNWRYEKMLSLDMPIMSDDEKEEETLIDKIENRSEKAPDWAITYLTEMKATKEKVRNRFFDEAATIFEEAMEMNEKGITYYDVARKHSISEERARQLLKMVKEGLKD
jgi:RNA polymerase sigma factor (sigma-70 family)